MIHFKALVSKWNSHTNKREGGDGAEGAGTDYDYILNVGPGGNGARKVLALTIS